MEGHDEQQPRPNPRFAGMEAFLVIGVETVSRGITQGEVGAIVGGHPSHLLLLGRLLHLALLGGLYSAQAGYVVPPAASGAAGQGRWGGCTGGGHTHGCPPPRDLPPSLSEPVGARIHLLSFSSTF